MNENANSFFATRCRYWSSKNSCFPGNAVHKAALSSQPQFYQALQAWCNENETNRPNHRRLASRKGGVWKNESMSESFGSCWASKVKINAYYKTMKVFFDLACMSTCCWGSQNQNMNISLHIIGALLKCNLFLWWLNIQQSLLQSSVSHASS